MFKTARPSVGGVGMRLMQKMGWRFGEGLGKEGTGNLEPLTLDVKSDRKGLLAREDLTPIYSKAIKSAAPDVAGKHPVSLVMELCAKRKWAAPVFTCMESGPPNQRVFLWKVVVNGTEYQPISASRSKKDAKSVACQVVLQSLGLVPRDSNLPVLI
uniref:Protein SON n=1 Tax=Heterorhabditis bacteriophora TaxID=37862 RepID=A0A1I7XRN3_HETBA